VRENLISCLLVTCLLHLTDVSSRTCEVLRMSVLHACQPLLPTHSCGPALGCLAMLDQTLQFWIRFAFVLSGLLCIYLLAHRSKRTGIIGCPLDIGSHDLPLWPNFSLLGVSHSVRLSLFPWGTHKTFFIVKLTIDHFHRWLINSIDFPAVTCCLILLLQ
jgi:hypothetical protein